MIQRCLYDRVLTGLVSEAAATKESIESATDGLHQAAEVANVAPAAAVAPAAFGGDLFGFDSPAPAPAAAPAPACTRP